MLIGSGGEGRSARPRVCARASRSGLRQYLSWRGIGRALFGAADDAAAGDGLHGGWNAERALDLFKRKHHAVVFVTMVLLLTVQCSRKRQQASPETLYR